MSMLDLNTVLPSLISELTQSKLLFGMIYSIILGVPLIFNIVFSHYLKSFKYKKKFLLLGIYLRAFAFLGMSFFTFKFSATNPDLVLQSIFFWIFLFSISAGFAGISYADIIGKMLDSKERTQLYAVKQFFASIAAFVGGLLISKIFNVSTLNFPYNYSLSLLIGFIGLVIASIGFYLLKEPPSEIVQVENDNFISYLKNVPVIIKNDPKFRRFIIIENLASFGVMILPFYMIFSKDTFNIDNSYIGKYLMFQVIGTIFSNIIWTFVARKYNSKTILKICISLGAIIPIIAILLSTLGPDYFMILFFFVGFIISGRIVGFEPYILDIAPSNKRTEYLGIRGTLNIFVVILPILGGTFINFFGYYPTFLIVSLAMLSALYLLNKND
jgi:MFS family permease